MVENVVAVSDGALLKRIREFIGYDRERFAKEILHSTYRTLHYFEVAENCRVPLMYMERAVLALDPEVTPGELEALCAPIIEVIARREFARSQGLDKAFRLFRTNPTEERAAELHQSIALYLVNFEFIHPKKGVPE